MMRLSRSASDILHFNPKIELTLCALNGKFSAEDVKKTHSGGTQKGSPLIPLSATRYYHRMVKGKQCCIINLFRNDGKSRYQ